MLAESQRNRIIRRHRDSLNRHGYSAQALYWSSQSIQETRFKILAQIGIHSGDSLLDVGCGFGDFKTWLDKQGIQTQYSGLDLSPDLLTVAQRHHPNVHFYNEELGKSDFSDEAFDWCVLSGALNEVVDDDGAYTYRIIKRMFALCRKGVAFNLLSKRNPNMQHFPDLQSHDPEKVLDFCKTLRRNSRCIEGYLANDFTIYICK